MKTTSNVKYASTIKADTSWFVSAIHSGSKDYFKSLTA